MPSSKVRETMRREKRDELYWPLPEEKNDDALEQDKRQSPKQARPST